MIFRTAMALALGLAAPVAAFEGAPLECNFQTECYDAAGCEPTDYSLSVRPDGADFIMSDTAEDVPAEAVLIDRTTAFLGRGNSAIRLLTGTEGETARLSVHSAGGNLMLNYAGTCEAAE
ncbi:hypothetical protein [Palleronia abyssalis]|uniref:Uncharacterized protein n=1 Tax=Palleronia abyssalis TaxID=1501240 RepID=A0A2R8BQ61_9RHOB|nr:hypothetical protein [Palleronia abyssalis]SPJ22304.1 hypothetical protein PAA8504_00094 [Palleronia abyssalis]